MKAVRVHTPGDVKSLVLDEKIAVPTIGDNEVLVNVVASGVNFIDTYHRTGFYKLPLPAILGREAAGVIAKVGKDVKEFKEGQRVAFLAAGTYAEQVKVDAAKVLPVPDEMSLDDAAAVLLQGLTAHYLTNSTYPIQKGDTVLIHAGAGGTGGLMIQMAKMRGASVITTVSTSQKAEVAKGYGADHVINYAESNFEDEVMKITEKKGVQCVYDGVGLKTYQQSMNCLRRRGYLVCFGNASGGVPPIDPLKLCSGGSLFLTRPTLADYTSTRSELLQRSTELFEWVASKKLKVAIAKKFALADAAAAHSYLEGRKAIGKILLIVGNQKSSV